MVRWNVFAAAVAVVAGAALVTGASVKPKDPADDVKPAGGKPPAIVNGTGYFNMAKVMRDYKFAQNQVKELNSQKERMSKNLIEWRAQYAKLQQDTQNDMKLKEAKAQEMLLLSRKIEDEDRTITQRLNTRATEIISELHDNIQAEVAKLAKERGLAAVLAFPDAVTPEEKRNPQIKELKLKPPALQPFFLDPSVDYTDELIKRLNAKLTADGGDK